MAIRRRGPQAGMVSTKIPVYMTNSVGRQSPNRRQPNEAQNIDNAMISLERNFEKRPGFEIVPQKSSTTVTSWNIDSTAIRLDLFSLAPLVETTDLFYYWYSINEENSFLVVIDYNATFQHEKLFYIFRVYPTGTWEELTPQNQWDGTDSTIPTSYDANNLVSVEVEKYRIAKNISYATARTSGVVSNTTRNYITYKSGTKTANESLKAVSLGSSVVILNKNVRAGFSSDIAGKLFNLDGTVSSTDDVAGRKITYYTASKVAKVYDKGDDEISATDDDILLGWRPGYITGKVQSGSNDHIILDSTASNINDTYNGMTLKVTSNGTGLVQTRVISDYEGGTTRRAHINTALAAGPFSPNPTTNDSYLIELTGSSFISADDYFYYKSDKQYLGQKVDDISEIKLPPETDDWYNTNESTTDTKARQMLRELYDSDTKLNGIIDGRGKIYFAVSPYLNTTSGFYRIISWNPSEQTFYYDPSKATKIIFKTSGTTVVSGTTYNHTTAITSEGRPYLQKVRTPDEHSYIDPRRMPQKLVVEVATGNITSWKMEPIEWTPRTSGDKKTNPGPSIFKTVDRKALRQVPITSIAVFKDRLWFAADDVVFSSQMAEYENLFLDDPANIVTTDPIDIRVSSNNYCEITSMTPFEDYMFINTKANTQFQLSGASDAEISPSNIAVAPVTYYSTAPILDPQFIGSRLYFFDSQRLFLFTGKGNMGYASAVEVSSQASGYLPRKYRCATTAPAQDTLLFVDEDNKNHIYCYTNRYSGDRVIQNSFYRYILPPEDQIETIQCYDNYMYVVSRRRNRVSFGWSDYPYSFYLYRNLLLSEDPYIPRLDRMHKLKIISSDVQPVNWNASYDPYTNITTFRIPGFNDTGDQNRYYLVLGSDWNAVDGEDLRNTAIIPMAIRNKKTAQDTEYHEIDVLGSNYAQHNYHIYIGLKFKMKVELSTLFVRDENNNIIDGVLNIRSAVFRHYYTGPYDIEVTHRGRSSFVNSFIPTRPDYTQYEDLLPLEIFQVQGEYMSKIMGYSDSTTISISSEYPTPVNITNMEFKGKFKQKYTTIDT
jgi:hypothetical protein